MQAVREYEKTEKKIKALDREVLYVHTIMFGFYFMKKCVHDHYTWPSRVSHPSHFNGVIFLYNIIIIRRQFMYIAILYLFGILELQGWAFRCPVIVCLFVYLFDL